ncbi:MAG TPA: 3-oxoacyl-ACP reductase family protein [Stellaceae bacterium]
MVGRLTGKVALVTGGSRGIGAAIAERLAADGADVAISYSSSSESAERVVAGIRRSAGVRAEAFHADAADPAAVKALVPAVVEQFGRLDILVNNAGIWQQNILTEATEEEFDRIVGVNVRAVFLAAREAARVMQPGGRIINIGSVLGERVPFPGVGLYSMSKFAVAGLTRAWARDLGPRGITVNCIQPGPVDTEMNPATGDFAAVQRQGTALDRYGRADEIAAAASFLASPEATYVTGATINVDGGTIA